MGLTVSLDFDETDIIRACVRQERWAQQALYEEFFGALMGISLRYAGSYDEAMDILHDSFIKIFQKIERYEQGTSLKSWMSRIVVNTAIDHFRKLKRQRTEDLDMAIAKPLDSPGPLQKLEEKELLICIQSLPPVCRATFNLYVIEGYSHREIAEKLGTTESTSRSNLVKARAKLRDILDNIKEVK